MTKKLSLFIIIFYHITYNDFIKEYEIIYYERDT